MEKRTTGCIFQENNMRGKNFVITLAVCLVLLTSSVFAAVPNIYSHNFEDGTSGQFTDGSFSTPFLTTTAWNLDTSDEMIGSNSVSQTYTQLCGPSCPCGFCNTGDAFNYHFANNGHPQGKKYYVRFALKPDANWGVADWTKIVRWHASVDMGGSDLAGGLGVDPSGQFGIGTDGMLGAGQNFFVNASAPTIYDLAGEVHWFEIMYDHTTNPIKATLWIDDVKTVDVTLNAANYPSVPFHISYIQFDGTINSVNSVSTAWWDEIGISTQKIGEGYTPPAPFLYEHGFEDGLSGQFDNGIGQPFIPNSIWSLDTTIANQGSNSVMQTYPVACGGQTGCTCGNGCGNVGQAFNYFLPEKSKKVYVRLAHRVDPNADLTYPWKGIRFHGSSALGEAPQGGTMGTLLFNNHQFFWDNYYLPGSPGGTPNMGPAPNPVTERGTWKWYEMMIDITDPSLVTSAIWIDGVLTHNYTKQYNHDPNHRFNFIQFDGTVNSVTVPSTAWFDDVAVSDRRIGIPNQLKPNEPPGFTQLTNRGFDALDEDGWGGNTPTGYSIVSDPNAPYSPNNVGQIFYPSGYPGGSNPTTREKIFGTQYEELYTSFWIKYSSNWEGHSSGVNKNLFFWIHGDASVYLSAQGVGNGPLEPQVRLQAVPGGSRNLAPTPGTTINRGQWHHWEVLLKSGTAGNSDGSIEWWLDGTKVGTYTNEALVGVGENNVWELIQWAPVWGGIGGNTVNNQDMQIDQIYVSGKTTSGPDTTPAVITTVQPNTNTLPSGTSQTPFQLTTNEPARCKYDTTPGRTYSQMIFTITGGLTTTHSTTLSGLSDGNNYNYYVRCRDAAGNDNTADHVVSFSVDNPFICEATVGNCYYVDPVNGDDNTGDGSWANPWQSLANIIYYYNSGYRPPGWASIQPGDYIYLMDGVHTTTHCPGDCSAAEEGGPYFGIWRSLPGDPNNWYHLKAYPGHNPVLDAQGTSNGLRFAFTDYWEVQGLEVRDVSIGGANSELGAISFAHTRGVLAHDLHVWNTDGTDNANMAGIHNNNVVDGVYNNLTLHDNYDRTNGDTGGAATPNSAQMVFFAGGNITVHNSSFYNTQDPSQETGGCLKYKHSSSSPTSKFEVAYNIFNHCKFSSISTGTPGSYIHHNLFYDTAGIWNHDGGGPTHQINHLIEFNTFYDISRAGFHTSPLDYKPTLAYRDATFPDDPKNITFQNNIVYDNYNGYYFERGTVVIDPYMTSQMYGIVQAETNFDNNCYYNAAGNLLFSIASTNGGPGGTYGLLGWQQAYGWDTNSLETDPLFTDVANNDFTLQPSSQCTHAGLFGTGNNPGGPPGQSLTNECSAPWPTEWIMCDDFETDMTGIPPAGYYFEHRGAGNFVRTAGVGVSGSTGMQQTYAQGSNGASGLTAAFGRNPDGLNGYRKPIAGTGNNDYDDVYWRMYLKHPSTWTGGGPDKLSRALVFSDNVPGQWTEAVFGHLWSGGNGDQLILNPASGTDWAGNLQTLSHNDFANMRWNMQSATGGATVAVGPTPIFDSAHVGQWYCIEAHLKLNDPGTQNGIFEFWIDDQLEARQTNLNLRGVSNTYTNYEINTILFENYWNTGSPVTQDRYMDNFVISTARIGCGNMSSPPPGPDTTPAVISNGAPTGVQNTGTTQVTLSVDTNEAATCRFSVSKNVPFNSMQLFSSTGATTHTQTLSSLADGFTYNAYVKCMDGSGNINLQDYRVSFSVSNGSAPQVGDLNFDDKVDLFDVAIIVNEVGKTSGYQSGSDMNSDGEINIFDMVRLANNWGNRYSPDTDAPIVINFFPANSLPNTVGNVQFGLRTDESAVCRYSTTPGTAFGSMIPFGLTGGIDHRDPIATTPDTAYSFYVKCSDTAGNTNVNDTNISFTVGTFTPPTPSNFLFASTLYTQPEVTTPLAGFGPVIGDIHTTFNGFNGAESLNIGEFIRVPQSNGAINNIELDQGTVNFMYRPAYNHNTGSSLRAIFSTATWGTPGSLHLTRHSASNGYTLTVFFFHPGGGFTEQSIAVNDYSWNVNDAVNVTVTWDFTGNADVKVYLDGIEPTSSNPIAGVHVMPAESTTEYFYIGGRENTGSSIANGIIGDFSISDTVSAPVICSNGATRNCGSNVGACMFGTETCTNGQWGVCTGGVVPITEICSDSVDNDCDGQTDENCGGPIPGLIYQNNFEGPSDTVASGQFHNGQIGNAFLTSTNWQRDTTDSRTGAASVRYDYPLTPPGCAAPQNCNVGQWFTYDLTPNTYDSVYVRFAYKQSDPFNLGNQEILKFIRFRDKKTSPTFALGAFELSLNAFGCADGQISWSWENYAPATGGCANQNSATWTNSHPGFVNGDIDALADEWHWYEVHLDISQSGSLRVEAWIDDVLYMNHTGAYNNQGKHIEYIEFDGIINRMNGPGSAWFDDVVIATQKIGIPSQQTGAVPDPTLLPNATGQLSSVTTSGYTIAGPGDALSSGQSYIDPLTGVTVWKVTDQTTPNTHPVKIHSYGEGGPYISNGWGPNGDTHTLMISTSGWDYWLVDHVKGVGLTNWRDIPSNIEPQGDLTGAWSFDPATPRILYSYSGNQIHRIDTSVNPPVLANTGHFPSPNLGPGGWMHQDKNDEWFVKAVSNTNITYAWNAKNNTLLSIDMTGQMSAGNSDEPHLERNGRYVLLLGPDVTIWDLHTDSITHQFPPRGAPGFFPIFHVGNMLGFWTGNHVDMSAPYSEFRVDANPGAINPFWQPSMHHCFHHAGQWIQEPNTLPNNDGNKAWVLASTYCGVTWPNMRLYDGLGFFRADGSDYRILAHTYSTTAARTPYLYWQLPRATISPDGKLVMFESNQSATNGHSQVYLAEVPTSGSSSPTQYAPPDLYQWSFEGGDDVTASGAIRNGGGSPMLQNLGWSRSTLDAHSGSQSAMLTLPQGQNDYSGDNYYVFSQNGQQPQDHYYVRYWIKRSPTYPIADNVKIIKTETRVYADKPFTLTNGGGIFGSNYGACSDYLGCTGSPMLGQSPQPSDALGTWQCVEVEHDSRNWTGQGVGTITNRVWVDEVLELDWTYAPPGTYNSQPLLPGPSEAFLFYSTTDSQSATQTEYAWIDDLAVSTQRIGCNNQTFPPADIVDASFETGWDGFEDLSGGTPRAWFGGHDIQRSQAQAYDGTWSAESTFTPGGGAVYFSYPFSDRPEIYARLHFYATAYPDDAHKWIRFYTNPSNFQHGINPGSNMRLSWPFPDTNPGNVGLDINGGVPALNQWHCLEIHYQRNANPWPRVRFWLDEQPIYQPDGKANLANPSHESYWQQGWLYSGVLNTNYMLNKLVIDDTINSNNNNAGSIFYDRIALSSQRIGCA